MMDHKKLFDVIRQIKGSPLTQADVDAVNAALIPAKAAELSVSPRGIKLLHSFEGCRLKAYPDPGSKDGHPWTIGWGSTGPGIGPGVVWTQEQVDARFLSDLTKFSDKVAKLLDGVPTTQSQFDALVSLAYNIGVNALAGSTVLRRHKAGDHKGAQAAFAMWNRNDGRVMQGLVNRRRAEAELYGS